MSCNKYRRHVLVIPEDDANAQLATGFVLGVTQHRNVQILPAAGGWPNVCQIFISEHIKGMREYTDRNVVLLLDFDDLADRRQKVEAHVPSDLASRVFVLGARSEPEALKQAGLGSFEQIGNQLATECRAGTSGLWSHELLQHNAVEINRLGIAVRATLF